MARHVVAITAIMAGCMLTAVQAETPKTDWASRIRSAESQLLSASQTPESALNGFQGLLDVLTQMADAEKGIPDVVRTKIGVAASEFRKNPAFDGKSVELLSEAYQGLAGGKAFAFPADVRGIKQATQAVQSRIDGCVTAIESGDRLRAVRELLDAILIVATPVLETR